MRGYWTVTVAVPLFPSLVAVITTLPFRTPCTTPDAWRTAGDLGVLDDSGTLHLVPGYRLDQVLDATDRGVATAVLRAGLHTQT